MLDKSDQNRTVAGLLCGLIFGIGLALSGMVDPANVIGFLDIAGNWNPSLIFVMGGAVVVAFFGFRTVMRQPKPLLDTHFHLPLKRHIDAKMITGAAIFGVGWGISGYCPGPAIASLSDPSVGLIAFLATSVLGAFLAQKVG